MFLKTANFIKVSWLFPWVVWS